MNRMPVGNHYLKMRESTDSIELSSIQRDAASSSNGVPARAGNETRVLVDQNSNPQRATAGSNMKRNLFIGGAVVASYIAGIATMAVANRGKGDGEASKNVMDALDVRLKQLHTQASSDYLSADKTNILCDKPETLINLAQSCSSFDGTQDDDFSLMFATEYWNKPLNCTERNSGSARELKQGIEGAAVLNGGGDNHLFKRANSDSVLCAIASGNVLDPQCNSTVSKALYQAAIPMLEECAKNPNLALTAATGMKDRLSLLSKRDPQIQELSSQFLGSRNSGGVIGSNPAS